jgi:hypothetical protein
VAQPTSNSERFDIAERYERALYDYRRATGQDLQAGLKRSYFRQNARGLVWLGISLGIALGVILVSRTVRNDQVH